MKIGEDQFLLDCLSDDILNKALYTGNILQHMLIRLPNLALDVY